MKKRCTFLFLISFICSITFSQGRQAIADSLKQQLAISNHDSVRVKIMVDLCNLYKNSLPDTAIFYGQKALALARQIDFPKAEATSMHYLGMTYRVLGDFSKALELHLKSLKVADKNKLVGEKGLALQQLGSIYLESKLYSKAVSCLLQSITQFESVGNYYNGVKASALNNLSRIHYELNHLDSADYYSKLAAAFIKKNSIGWMRTLNLKTIGLIQSKKGEHLIALEFLKESLLFAIEGGADNNTNVSMSSFEIAKIYKQINQPDSAIDYALQALVSAQNGKYYAHVVKAGSLLSELYETKDVKKAIAFYKTAKVAQDSLTSFENFNAIKNLTDFDEKERQYEIETARKAFQHRTRQNALLAGLGVFLLVAFIQFRNNKQKQKANKVLEQTLSSLKATQSQLIQSEKMASLGELTAGIAHEIQNPLNFVNNFSEVNQELISELVDEVDKENYEEVKAIAKDIKANEEKISHHGKRADAIVKGMLQHSRSNSGKKEPTNINALADEYLRLAYHGLRAKDKSFNASMKTEFDESIGKIHVVPQDMGRVILNLISNAFYAVDEKKKQQPAGYEPTVSVSTKKTNGKVEIVVSDNGNGIPDAVKEKIFQPFFTTKPTGQGTGLGLSLAYDIVKSHSGELLVQTKESEGAVFKIILPVG